MFILTTRIIQYAIIQQGYFMKKLMLATALALCAAPAFSSDVQQKTMKVIIPQASSSGLGHIFRLLDAYAAKNNITLIPEFKPGASGKIGLDHAASTKGDFLLLSTISDLVEQGRSDSFKNVSAVSAVKLMLVSSVNSNVKSIEDIVSIERKNPGKLKWAYSTSAQLTLIDTIVEHNKLDQSAITIVKYGATGPSTLVSTISGDVDLTITLPHVADPLIKDNRIAEVKLDQSTANKLATKINVVGMFLPKNTSQDVTTWVKFVNDFLNDQDTKTRFAANNFETAPTGTLYLNNAIRNWSQK